LSDFLESSETLQLRLFLYRREACVSEGSDPIDEDTHGMNGCDGLAARDVPFEDLQSDGAVSKPEAISAIPDVETHSGAILLLVLGGSDNSELGRSEEVLFVGGDWEVRHVKVCVSEVGVDVTIDWEESLS
jgi:hypothetical protein